MANPKVVTGFNALKEDELDTVGQSIINKMTGNPNFTSPIPPLADVQTALDEFMAAMADLGAGKGSTIIKDQKKTTLLDLLTKLATYVQLNCQDDAAIIESSGFKIKQAKTPIGPLPKPVLKVEAGGPGQVKLTATSVGANSYQFEYTLAPATTSSTWQVNASTKSKTVVNGLTSGKQYTFRVAGVGTDPSRIYSDEITSFVL